MRQWHEDTGAAELPYWHAYLRISDEIEMEKLQHFGLGGL